MTMARNALRTMSIFRFSTLTNNLNFLNQSKHVYKMTCDSKINLYVQRNSGYEYYSLQLLRKVRLYRNYNSVYLIT